MKDWLPLLADQGVHSRIYHQMAPQHCRQGIDLMGPVPLTAPGWRSPGGSSQIEAFNKVGPALGVWRCSAQIGFVVGMLVSPHCSH